MTEATVRTFRPSFEPSDLENGRFEGALRRFAPEQCQPTCEALGTIACSLTNRVRAQEITADRAMDVMSVVAAEYADCPGRYSGACANSTEIPKQP